MDSISISRTESDTSSKTSPSSSGATKSQTMLRSRGGRDSKTAATSAGCNSAKRTVSSVNLSRRLASSIGTPASICSKDGSRISHKAWMRSISSEMRSSEMRSSTASLSGVWSRFGGVCSMLINAPPAGRGEAFRRDDYCCCVSDGKFKGELGRSIIRAC